MAQDGTAFEPTIPQAARRHWHLVALGAVIGAGFGLAMALLAFNESVADATVLIEDPNASAVFDTGQAAQPERYLASQVAILESPDIAQTVASLEQSGGLSARDVLESRTVISDPAIDLIRVEFTHSDPDTAVQYANTYLLAYDQYRTDVTKETFEAAISGLDASIAVVDEERAAVDAEIEAVTTIPGEGDLIVELEAAIRAFLASPSSQATPEEIEGILGQLESLQVIRALENQNPTLVLLYETRRDIMDRRSQLVVRRDQLMADAALQSTGIAAISEATEAQLAVGRARVVLITALFGAIAGVTLAYARAMRTRRFAHPSEPEAVLDTPMLAEIPEFDRYAPIPVNSDPMSAEAEAFRFAAGALVARLGQLEAASDDEASSVLVTSALNGEGKTSVVVNAGLALATRGKSVLIIDADFEDPALTRLLVGDADALPGISDLAAGTEASLEDVTFSINTAVGQQAVGAGHRVDLLTKGSAEVSPADFFDSTITSELLRILGIRYDYVLIDAPSLLQMSYVTSLARITDAVVLVAPHNGLVSQQQEVRKRLDIIGARLLGYIYNRAPKRADARERRNPLASRERSEAAVS